MHMASVNIFSDRHDAVLLRVWMPPSRRVAPKNPAEYRAPRTKDAVTRLRMQRSPLLGFVILGTSALMTDANMRRGGNVYLQIDACPTLVNRVFEALDVLARIAVGTGDTDEGKSQSRGIASRA